MGEDTRATEKSEYSLTQHLANNLIDMYINLPSKNHYRRPASYTSKGYTTRRMAVDFAVPLITNVKNAKLLAEALVRKLPLDVSNIDSKTSHRTHIFPGLVNVGAFVPNVSIRNSDDLITSTEASLSSGFTTTVILPSGDGNAIVDQATLDQALSNVSGAHCNFALGITATPDNVSTLDEEIQSEVKFIFIPDDTSLAVAASHFASWPGEKIVLTNARGSNLASLLLLASLHSRNLHVTDVRSAEDLALIALTKSKGLRVTCDVSVYSLFFTSEQFAQAGDILPTPAVQAALWNNLSTIDVFSTGPVPYLLAKALGNKAGARSGVAETLPLLLTAVVERRLTLDDIKLRLHDNPVHIFGVAGSTNTQVEVVLDMRVPFTVPSTTWSPVKKVSAGIHRVAVHGHTTVLDGALSSPGLGRDISSVAVPHSAPAFKEREQEVAHPLPAFTSLQPSSLAHAPSLSGDHALSLIHPHPAFHRRHILSVKQFTQKDIYDLFTVANEMRIQVERNGSLDILRGKVLASVFYEPSTRTSSSFDAAMKRLGGQVVQVAADNSSVMKGESLPDTIRTLACYGDAIVIRHPQVGSAQEAAKYSTVPVINAGDGIGEHPTQVRRLLMCRLRTSHLSLFRHSLISSPSAQNSEQSTDAQSHFSAISRTAGLSTAL